jgi:hypothetical protein
VSPSQLLAIAAPCAASLLVACTNNSVASSVASTEPIVVAGAQFIVGPLPGVAPPDASVDAGPPQSPTVTDVNVANAIIRQGEEGLAFSGHATANAQTVAVRFVDLGTGYWIAPVGALDPSDENLPTWQLTASFGRDLPAGLHTLLFAAVDSAGASGTDNPLTTCIDTVVPDNLNICVPSRPPPPAVLSLAWDNPVDLDIILETPSGQMVGGPAFSVAAADSGVASSSPSPGVGIELDHHSNVNCVIDDVNREDLVWSTTPTAGSYQVWVDLVRACGQPAVSFTVSLWLAQPVDGGTHLVQETPPVAVGELTNEQANGGASPGLFVGSFVVQ